MTSPALIGLGAGLVSAVLFVSSATGSVLAMVLAYVTPLPLLLAGLGWGLQASIVGFVAGAVLTALTLGGAVSGVFGLYVGIPAVGLTYLVSLHRVLPQDDQGQTVTEWYPPGRIIAWMTLLAGVLGALGVVILGMGNQGYEAASRALFEQTFLKALDPVEGQKLSPEQIDQFAQLFSRLLPAATAAIWLLVMLANVWIAAKIAAISDRLSRPWPDFSAMTYPRFLSLLLAAALALSLAPGLSGIMATSFIGALVLAYMLMGLIIIHTITRGARFQVVMLVLLYAGIMLIGWVGLAVALVGLSDSIFALRERFAAPNGPDRGA